jgi:hypothetical protein
MMELTLFHRSYVGLKSADIAGGAMLLARYILGKPRRVSFLLTAGALEEACIAEKLT